VVLISSELEEILGLAHRVLVMRRGRVVSEPILTRMESARWATFDCYGTLVDWNSGI
jgi:ABC-type sugar transport system ATPase subunit